METGNKQDDETFEVKYLQETFKVNKSRTTEDTAIRGLQNQEFK